jgi:hypothetical protein
MLKPFKSDLPTGGHRGPACAGPGLQVRSQSFHTGSYPSRRREAATSAGLANNAFPNPFARPPAGGLIWDLLDAHNIGWANYFVELP